MVLIVLLFAFDVEHMMHLIDESVHALGPAAAEMARIHCSWKTWLRTIVLWRFAFFSYGQNMGPCRCRRTKIDSERL